MPLARPSVELVLRSCAPLMEYTPTVATLSDVSMPAKSMPSVSASTSGSSSSDSISQRCSSPLPSLARFRPVLLMVVPAVRHAGVQLLNSGCRIQYPRNLFSVTSTRPLIICRS